MSTWTLDSAADQTGRVAIVTGSNSGIGFETAAALALKGATVVMACRNATKGEAARTAILEQAPGGDVTLMSLDLSSLSSVEAFATAFGKVHDRLDLLINNAGVMIPPYTQTEDGFELQFGTNHLGHYALTGRLLPLITKTGGARIVTVASLAHKFGKIDFDDLNHEKSYWAWPAYGQSKLANLLFTAELQRRLKAAGHDTIATAAHPGWTATNLQANSFVARVFNPLMAMKPPEGALPTLRAALDPDATGDAYFGPAGMGEMKGPPVVVPRTKAAQDAGVAERLWGVSAELTGVAYLK
ncbi:MAG: NAD(P)-dependent dehydrogenase (short-subunit alcohol dehydrogenase family) [Myxococcota bacterium]|jgi:NAD(P)-dependent dehydrogenase (short-subunit alcohol dehydrogenase family)